MKLLASHWISLADEDQSVEIRIFRIVSFQFLWPLDALLKLQGVHVVSAFLRLVPISCEHIAHVFGHERHDSELDVKISNSCIYKSGSCDAVIVVVLLGSGSCFGSCASDFIILLIVSGDDLLVASEQWCVAIEFQ